MNLAAIVTAKSFETLDESTKAIITTIMESQNVIDSALGMQTAKLEELRIHHVEIVGCLTPSTTSS
jgi:hypothetical protein